MALPEIRKTRAAQAKETAATEKNAQLNTVQTALQTDIATFTRKTAGSLQKMFSLQKSQAELERLKAGAELESRRELARKGGKKEKAKSLNDQFTANFGFPIFGIGSMIAGISAIAGAAVGLRGWEAKTLKSIFAFTKIGPTIVKAFKSIRNSVLAGFGLTARGTIVRDPVTGRFFKSPSIVSQVSVALSQFRTRLLNSFGIGADGKLVKIQGKAGLNLGVGGKGILSTIRPAVQALVNGVSKIFQPIKAAGQLATKSLSGAFGGIMRAIGTLGGFAKLFGTILKPIGIVFSLFDGVKTFMNTEGSLFARINEGISAALGDFVGAPLDLLKTGLVWVADNLLGKDNFISKFLTSFSVEQVLKDIVATPGRILTGAFEQIIEPLLNGEIDVVGQNIIKIFRKMFDAIYGIFSSIVNFVAEKLGLDFRLGEDEVSKKERELQEIQKKKAQLENKEKKLEEKLSERQEDIAVLQAKLDKFESEYIDYLTKVGEGTATRNEARIIGGANQIDRLDEQIKKLQAQELEERKKLEEEKKKLLFAEKSALFDVKDFVSGSMTGNPSGNGAASTINQNLLADYMRGYANEGTAYIDQSDKKTIIKNENNNYGGNQRVEPVSRYGYNFDSINFAAGAYGG